MLEKASIRNAKKGKRKNQIIEIAFSNNAMFSGESGAAVAAVELIFVIIASLVCALRPPFTFAASKYETNF